MTRLWLALIFCLGAWAPTARAHHSLVAMPGDPEPPALRQEGRLVSVELVFGEPLRLFIVGREEAKLDLATLQVTVRRLKPYPGKVYTANRQGDFFVIPEFKDLRQTSDLEVRTQINDQSESLHFKIKPRIP